VCGYKLIISLTILMTILSLPAPALHAAGLYLDPAGYFSVVDTTAATVTVRHVDFQRDEGRGSIVSGEVSVRPSRRVHLRFGLFYPNFQRQGYIMHGAGDGFVRASVRVFGDTLDASGLFLRGDARVPIGSGGLRPFASGSMDGGVGLEFRGGTSLFGLRAVSTYTLVGDRIKEGEFIHRNFFFAGLAIDFPLGGRTNVRFGGFSARFRGGASREIYLLTARCILSDSLELCVDAALEAGPEEDRVFDSLLSVAAVCRFPGSAPPEEIE